MSNLGARGGAKFLVQALLRGTALTLLGLSTPCLAQQGSSGDSAHTSRTRSFDIPAQPLTTAITAFGDQAGLQVTVDGAILAGLSSQAVIGQFGSAEALSQLLAGSGVTWRWVNNRSVALERAPQAAQGAIQLGPVRVEGGDGVAGRRDPAASAESSAWAPAGGFVARRSATATKTDTPIAETPRSISVITREQIDTQQPRTISEVLSYVAGVVSRPGPTGTTDVQSLYIRGFESFDGDSFFLDGTRAKFQGWWGFSATEPYGLERVEVLRGPASILYGSGQPSGTINLVSKKPTILPSHEVGVEAGSYNRKQVTADLSGPLTEDGVWSYRLTGLYRDADTQADFSKDNRQFLALSLAWRPGDRTELVLRASYTRNEGEHNTGLPEEGVLLPNINGPIPIGLSLSDRNVGRYDNKSLAYEFSHALDDSWTVRQNVRLSQMTGERESVIATGFVDAGQRVVDRGISTYHSVDGNYVLSIDNQIEARFRHGIVEHTLLAGLDYLRQRDRWQYLFPYFPSVGPIDLYAPVYTPYATPEPTQQLNMNDEQIGIYGQDQIKIDGQIVLSLGIRHDWVKHKYESVTLADGSLFYGDSQKDRATTGQAGIAYVSDAGLTPYFSYATSFIPTGGVNLYGTRFRPETGRQFELGLKYQPPGSNTLLTAAIFDLRRQNVTTTDPANRDNQIQVGEVASKGLELEGRSEIAEGFNVVVSYTYTDIEVTKDNDGDVGKRLRYAPEHVASAWIDYEVPAGELKGLGGSVGVRYIGPSFTDQSNVVRMPGYTVLDLGLRYDLGGAVPSLEGLQLLLNASNVANKTYFVNSSTYGAKRTVSALLRYRW